MVSISYVTIVVLLSIVASTNAFRIPTTEALTSQVYVKADDNLDGLIGDLEFDDFSGDMDLDDDRRININEFIQGWTSLTRQSNALARALFLIIDDDLDDYIDDDDIRALNFAFDTDDDGFLDELEFFDGLQTLFYRAPFVVLFELADDDDLFLDDLEFAAIFSPFLKQANRTLTRATFQAGWLNLGFGGVLTANYIFDDFDLDLDEILEEAEVLLKFSSLDLDGNGLLGFREVYKLADLIPHSKHLL